MTELGKLRENITIVGRNKDDLEKVGTKVAGFIGKHIVGTGEDAHLTTPVKIDLLKPHVILCSGKRGSGKSYSIAVILEEIMMLEKEYLEKTACVVFDPVGIYWSMKFPNEQQRGLLAEWKLEPQPFPNVKVYVPIELKEAYEKADIPVDHTIAISPREFSAEDWILAFNLEPTSEFAISLERIVSMLMESGLYFSLDDMVAKIKDDEQIGQHVKNLLVSYVEVAKSWGIFSEDGMSVNDIVKPSEVSIIDLSRVKGEEWGIRNLLAAWLTRQVYRERVIARKEEELAKIKGTKPKTVFPLTWLVFEEAHNFIPSDKKTVSSEPIKMIAKQGREPGVGLIVVSQMPNRIHQDILSQTDLVISFRLTSKADLEALHSVHQTYLAEELEKTINRLPRNPGACLVLDDNLEKLFTVNIRPRLSWHSGATAQIV